MDDYRRKRRYRQQKLERSGFYHLRRQRSRARIKAAAAGNIPAMEQIFASENLICSYFRLQRHAGRAPGPDGISYQMLGRREVGQLMRQLSQEVLGGAYEPSRARSIKIPKANGRGQRTLQLRSILHRVVAAAVADALGPYFDHLFLSGSHGFRPGRGTWSLLLQMEQIMIEQQRFVIAQDDLKNAFDCVPVDYAMKLLTEHIDDEQLLILTKKILRGHHAEQRNIGIEQGSALSPLMLNVALHHTLDLPFSSNAAHPPWLRYADNIVYLCRSAHEGATAIQAAQQLLTPIGMSFKGADGKPADLQKGEKAKILGLVIRWEKGQIKYDLTKEAWESLQTALSTTHTHTSPNTALAAVKGWMDACGPAFEGKAEVPILNRVREVLAVTGEREIPRQQLEQYFLRARGNWENRRRSLGKPHIARRGTQDRGNEPAPLATDRTGHLGMPEAEPPPQTTAAVSAALSIGGDRAPSLMLSNMPGCSDPSWFGKTN